MIILIDASEDSLTVSWPETKGAQRYVLQYRPQGQEEYSLLADKLTATLARKRNLKPSSKYSFRVGAVVDDKEPSEWLTSGETSFETLAESVQRMDAPTAVLAGTNQALLISWKASSNNTEASTYELQMRENIGGKDWTTLSDSLKNLEVRKKNLSAPKGYHFRVRAQGDAFFSPPSDVAVALGLSSGMHNLFRNLENGTLLKGKTQTPLAEALGGKEFVLLYASAHWCGPVRSLRCDPSLMSVLS